MQFKLVSLVVAAIAASAAAQNVTNGTNGTSIPTQSAVPDSAAFHNAVSGGLLGAVIAGGLALAL